MGGPGSGRTDQSKKTPELVDELLQRLVNGEPLTKICKDKRMPNPHTVYNEWLEKDPDFTHRYARAREQQLDTWANELVELAHESSNDIKTLTKGGKEVQVVNWENVKRSELQIRTRQWLLERLRRKTYGAVDESQQRSNITADLLELIKVVSQIGSNSQSAIKLCPPPSTVIESTPRHLMLAEKLTTPSSKGKPEGSATQ